jgi:phosphomannomutase
VLHIQTNGRRDVPNQEVTQIVNDLSMTTRITRAAERGRDVFPAAARRAKSTKPENLVAAIGNLDEWLTGDRFSDYREALIELLEIAGTDAAVADELYDSFYRVMPFGTGGRRSKVGIGPNRMNPYVAAMTAQGDAEFIIAGRADSGAPVDHGDLFLGAWDVREFHRYFAETASLERYRKTIDARCPALAGVSSRDLSEIAALVYAGNGIRYVHPGAMRPTPWLSFFINAWPRIAAARPFTGEAAVLNRCRRVLGGIVLSSSHNPYDNNGTKFYETSGAQTPPHVVDLLQRIGDGVKSIRYFGGNLYYSEGRKTAFEAARRSGMVVVLDEENLARVDLFYVQNSIEEIGSLYTADRWKQIVGSVREPLPLARRVAVSFNALNGTGATGVLKILETAGFGVLRSPGDVPSWEFTEGYGNVPNPEAEKTFNTGILIGIRRTLEALLSGHLRKAASIVLFIDEDGNPVPAAPFLAAKGADEVIERFRAATGKCIRGCEVEVAGTPHGPEAKALRDHVLANNICLLTDPDADRVGLGMQTFSHPGEGNRVRLHWVSANDNDESGIILFRYRLEKLLEMARRGELVPFIEGRRREDGSPAEAGQHHQLIVVNTVVSNPLEGVIAQKVSEVIKGETGGQVSVTMLTHHVGFKFTGEIIDNIKRGNAGLPFEGITGELMAKAGVNGKEAFFVMSSEEGEGSLIGYRGSIDKDSGVTGIALAALAAEQYDRGMTVHDYLMETYDLYGYSKVSLEPMVMTGEYGMTMINDHIMGYLRNELLPNVQAGLRPCRRLPGGTDSLILTGGVDHLDLMKQKAGEDPASWTATKRALPGDLAEWPVAIRESLNILEFFAELEMEQGLPEDRRTTIAVVMRPSGTEPKHKNMVKIVAPPRERNREPLQEYIGRVDALSRQALDAAMIASYDASGVAYDSRVVEAPGKVSFAGLSAEDRIELLRLFPIIVSAEAKLAVYFPLRTYLRREASRLAAMEKEDFFTSYGAVREKVWSTLPDGSTRGYLTNFNKTNGIEFIEESVRLNLARELDGLRPGGPGMAEVYVQALLWFGPEIGSATFRTLLAEVVARRTGESDERTRLAEAESVAGALADRYGPGPRLGRQIRGVTS